MVEIGNYASGRWECPSCHKIHGKPHYSLPDQINYNKRPAEKGRVEFNRRLKDDRLDHGTKIRYDVPTRGDQFDQDGFQRPLFCPHCGFEDEWIIIKRVGDLPGLVEQFLQVQNGQGLTPSELLYQFIGWLKGRGKAH